MPATARPVPEMRLGLVGCGRHAERGYAPAIAAARGVALVGTADPVRERRERLAPPGAAYETAAELIAAAPVDAVALASPAGAHVGDAKIATAAGLPVLVEKPPAEDVAGAIALAGLQPKPWIGFNLRFDPELQSLRERLRGADPVRVEITRVHRRGDAWRPYVVRDDALLALGSHLIDLALWLTGSSPLRARAGGLESDRSELELELERGSARIRCGLESRTVDLVEVTRPGGRLIARRSGGGLVRRAVRHLVTRRGTPGSVWLLALELEAFAAAARGSPAAPLAGAEDGVVVMTAIDAVRRSAAAGRSWEEVADVRTLGD